MDQAFYDHIMNNTCMTLTGHGQVTAVPDLAVLRLGVQTNGVNLSEVQYENATISQAVLQGLKSMGVTDIKTFQYSIDKLYDFVDGNRIDRGYTVRNILEIRTNQMDQVGGLIDNAVANGANVVDFISFEVSEPDFYYQQVLNLAVFNAMQKAKSIAVNLGFQTDPIPTNITENSTAPIPYQQPYPIRGEIAATPIEPGNKQIEATVTVDFVNIGRFNTEPY
jgi:uncharacterized protein YggE